MSPSPSDADYPLFCHYDPDIIGLLLPVHTWFWTRLGEGGLVISQPYREIGVKGRVDTLTNESVAAFAEEVERAYIYKIYGGHPVRVNFDGGDGIHIDEPQVTRADDGWIVHLTGGYTAYLCSKEGGAGVSDPWMSTYYFTNESAVYREEAGTNADVDPHINGTWIL